MFPVYCIGAWPRPKVIKLRPIFYVKFCSYLMFTLTLYLYHWPGVTTIQYNTIRSPLSQSKLEECCFLDKCIFSFIFSKEDSTKNSHIIITCSKVYVCPLLLHSKVCLKFNMGNVISIFRIENKCVHFSMKARQSAEKNGIKRILECWNKFPNTQQGLRVIRVLLLAIKCVKLYDGKYCEDYGNGAIVQI